MAAFRDIVCYPNLLPFEHTEANIDAFMATLAEHGVTHIQVNHLPDLMHPEQLAQPDNVYLWFANFGPPLDLFVSTGLNRGLWPEMYLERNRRSLLRFAAGARRHGLQPLLYLCEPRFVPERLFQRHPTLRGPRVDNPVCSRVPLFALCTDRPEVQAHYRDAMRAMLELVPDLSMATVFTSDSGAGFDYNPDSYAGPNGAGFNRGKPLEQRVNRFLSCLLEGARTRNPDFTVNLTSGFSPEWRAKILAAAPPGVIGSVYGLYDWCGGLEEQWGYHQAIWGSPKPKWNVRTLDRAAARADRLADMQQRFDVAARDGRQPIVHCEMPNTCYPHPQRYTPHPFETIRVLQETYGLGARRIAAWGVMSPSDLVPWNVNKAAMVAINQDIAADADTVVRGIAREWVGEAFADVLTAAWRDCDTAWMTRPLWLHFGLPKQGLLGPLVPDLARLKPAEIAYYRTIGLDDLERIQGTGSFIPCEADERNRDHVLHELYGKQTLPLLRRACTSLDQAAASAPPAAAAVLRDQAEYIRYCYLSQRMHAHWYEAGRYLAPGDRPSLERTMAQIIDDDLQVTAELVALLDGRAEKFLRIMGSDYMTYEFGPSFVSHLRQRLVVMKAHRDDPPASLKEALAKILEYQQSLTEYA